LQYAHYAHDNGLVTVRADREVALIWGASIALTAIIGVVGLLVPLVAQNQLALVAAAFLYLPALAIWKRGLDLTAYGLTAAPVLRGLILFVVVTAITLPLHGLGYHVMQGWLTDATPEASRNRLARFDRELDRRPTEPADGLLAWVEGDRFIVVWTGQGPQAVRLRVSPARIQSINPVRLEGDRLFRLPASRQVKARADGADALLSPGLGVSLDTRGLDTIEFEAETPDLFKGRWQVVDSTPYKTQRSPWWWLAMFGAQLVMVAIPEEWFYRGFVQKRLHEAWSGRRRILGVELGWGWVVSSALFAIGHLVLDPRPSRLAVFFPSLLFGWMRAKTGSILSSALFHAACNVWIQGLTYVWFG
jgi:membrane protease YdiL (CAAX protease family)